MSFVDSSKIRLVSPFELFTVMYHLVSPRNRREWRELIENGGALRCDIEPHVNPMRS